MKTIIKLSWGILACLLLFLFSCIEKENGDEPEENEKTDFKGTVTCGQQGIANVVVTDGDNFTITDTSGAFVLPYNSSATFVYISSPAGYAVPVESSVPKFWIRLSTLSDKTKISFTLGSMDVSDQKHYIIAVGDPQVRDEDELKKLKPILDYMKTDIKTNSFNPLHLMVVGDIVFDAHDMHLLSKQYFGDVEQPVYYAIGNHDHVKNTEQSASDEYDKVADNVYESHYGPTYYSFNRGQVHYIVLDNIFYRGGLNTSYSTYITPAQLEWIREDLTYVSDDKVLIVMCHSPTKSRFKDSYGNSESLHALLAGYKDVHIISGHTHYNSVLSDETGITEHTVGAACGGWWEGPVCPCGTYLGYKIFEIDGTSVTWKYRAYEKPDKQFIVFEPGSRDGSLPPEEELLVNVWDWDTTWTVEWSEDAGATYNAMARYVNRVYDPVAYEYFGIDGDNTFPVGRGWIDANPTDHMFTCVPSVGITNVMVKVVNHFGDVYLEEVDL